MKNKVSGWNIIETIEYKTSPFYNPVARFYIQIKTFCYEHNDPIEMRNFAGKMLLLHPEYSSEIRREILKVCPQYKEMLDKLIILIWLIKHTLMGSKKIKKVIDQSQAYQDTIKREEINNILHILSVQTKHFSGPNLDLLKKYLLKIVEY